MPGPAPNRLPLGRTAGPTVRLVAAVLLLAAGAVSLSVLPARLRDAGQAPSRTGSRGGLPPHRTPANESNGIDLGPAGHNCRFWGLVGQGYLAGLLEDQFRGAGTSTLRKLGGFNRDGWAFASFPSDTCLRRVLDGPLVRRGRPPADSPADPNFDFAVDEIQRLHPRALLAHVRTGTSGHFGIPNPHPFLHRPFAFAHNGGVPPDVCEELIADQDSTYLDRYPPEYVRNTIDSEIYFLWLMCYREAHPALPTVEALREAAAILWPRVNGARINFVLTQGDTLYALCCSSHDTGDRVRYYPNDDPASPFWIAASQPMGTEGSRWGSISATTLAVFVPGQAPSFYPIETPDPPVYSFRRIQVQGRDGDGDGSVSHFTVAAVAETNYGSRSVALQVRRRGSGEPVMLAESEALLLSAGRAATLTAELEVTPADLAAESWDLGVVLVDPEDPQSELTTAGGESNPEWGLSGLAVEGAAHDAGEPPDSLETPLASPPGRPRPNPSPGTFLIPLPTRIAAGAARLEVRSADGSLVFSAGNLPASGNPPAVSWNGLDLQGRRAAAGTYFCRIRSGSESYDTKVTVLR